MDSDDAMQFRTAKRVTQAATQDCVCSAIRMTVKKSEQNAISNAIDKVSRDSTHFVNWDAVFPSILDAIHGLK